MTTHHNTLTKVKGNVTFNSTYAFGSMILSDGDFNITATAGGDQSDGVPITNSINIVTTTTANLDSVVLPEPAATGHTITIINQSSYDVGVYPAVGDLIDSRAVNAYYPIASGSRQVFVANGASSWISTIRTLRYVTYPTAPIPTWANTGGISTLTWHATLSYTLTNAELYTPPSSWGLPVRFSSFISDNDGGIDYIGVFTPGEGGYQRFLGYQSSVEEILHYERWGYVASSPTGTFTYYARSSTPSTGYQLSIYGYWVIG